MTTLLKAKPVPHWTEGWEISCDFDGTITRGDVVQAMLNQFADPSWRDIEAEWESGRIGSRECLERQTRLLRVVPDELAKWVDTRPVDPQATAFFTDCEDLGLNVRIVSDGYDWVIARVLSRLGLQRLPVFANHLRPQTDGRWAVTFPFTREGCASGTCKCALVAADGPRLHIGDGRSDICVSDMCDLVFAKDSLLASREARGKQSVAYSDFAQIRAVLQRYQPPRLSVLRV